MKPKSVSLELGQAAVTGIALGRGSPQKALRKIVLFTYTPREVGNAICWNRDANMQSDLFFIFWFCLLSQGFSI